MNARIGGLRLPSRFLGTLAAVLGGAAVALSATPAAAAPVSVDLTSLRAIQTYALQDKADDQVYMVVTGVAKGKELEPTKLPKDGTWTAGPQKPPVGTKKPVTLWSGDLADGEFAQLTVTLFQGKGDDAVLKAYTGKLAEAGKAVAARSAAKLKADEAKKLSADTLKAYRAVVTKVKDVVGGREKNTDHFGGQFTLLVWNNNGKIAKRLDPVGLTFGEHAGNDVKVYSKLKYTRQNVQVEEEGGGYSEQQLLPLNDDENGVRVKMLESEFVKQGDKQLKNVTDYLAEIQVKADGKPTKWKLGGENLGISDLHTWWDYAE